MSVEELKEEVDNAIQKVFNNVLIVIRNYYK